MIVGGVYDVGGFWLCLKLLRWRVWLFDCGGCVVGS